MQTSYNGYGLIRFIAIWEENLVPTILEQAVTYFKAGEIDNARFLLIAVLKQNPKDEDAWLWLSRCVTETEQKRYCFEKALKINPHNQYALRSLRHLARPIPAPAPPPPPEIIPQKPVTDRAARLVSALLTVAMIGLGTFLVVLFLYAWWITR